MHFHATNTSVFFHLPVFLLLRLLLCGFLPHSTLAAPVHPASLFTIGKIDDAEVGLAKLEELGVPQESLSLLSPEAIADLLDQPGGILSRPSTIYTRRWAGAIGKALYKYASPGFKKKFSKRRKGTLTMASTGRPRVEWMALDGTFFVNRDSVNPPPLEDLDDYRTDLEKKMVEFEKANKTRYFQVLQYPYAEFHRHPKVDSSVPQHHHTKPYLAPAYPNLDTYRFALEAHGYFPSKASSSCSSNRVDDLGPSSCGHVDPTAAESPLARGAASATASASAPYRGEVHRGVQTRNNRQQDYSSMPRNPTAEDSMSRVPSPSHAIHQDIFGQLEDIIDIGPHSSF